MSLIDLPKIICTLNASEEFWSCLIYGDKIYVGPALKKYFTADTDAKTSRRSYIS